MQTIRLQDLTPEVYTSESRDFQILCRLYDSIFNAIKYDTDSMKYLTDSRYIRSGVLPLLQTKLGFLTKKSLDDSAVRYVLRVFPELLRGKGSLSAIKKLLNMCLKINNIQGDFTISYSDSATVINGIVIDAHTVIIGLDTILKNTELINEIAKYILPAGFSFYIYFYKSLDTIDNIYMNDDVKLLYSSSNLNAQVRGTRDNTDEFIDTTMPLSDEPLSYDLLGGVDIAWINSIDNEISPHFKGIFSSSSLLPSSNVEQDDVAIAFRTDDGVVYPDVYYYDSSHWHKLNFVGTCELSHSSPSVSNPQNYDIACSINRQKYLVYKGSGWVETNYRGTFSSIAIADNIDIPRQYDLISLTSGISDYKMYYNDAWIDVNYKATYSNENQVSSSYRQENNLILLNGANYWLYKNNWIAYTDTIYMLKKCLSSNDTIDVDEGN